MFVHESGTVGNPIIVFLHGNGANGLIWKTHMQQPSDYHCFAPNLPGFGRSHNLEWISLVSTTEEIIKLIQERSLKNKVSIVGLSLGGSLAITWLGIAPHMLDHVIIEGAGVQPIPGLPFMKVGFRFMQPFMHSEFLSVRLLV